MFLVLGAWVEWAVLLSAEVLDNEPTITVNWLVALVSGAVAVVAWRWRWWAGAIVTAVTSVWVGSMVNELMDPSVGAAIGAEAGQSHLFHFYGSYVVAALLHVLGIATRRKRTRY